MFKACWAFHPLWDSNPPNCFQPSANPSPIYMPKSHSGTELVPPKEPGKTGSPSSTFPQSWAFFICALFTLGGASNLGWTGPWLAAPFVTALLFLAVIMNRICLALGVLLLAAILYAAQTAWPPLYFKNIGQQVVLVKKACVFRNPPDNSLYLADHCSATPGLPEEVVGEVAPGHYTIVGAETGHSELSFYARYLLETPLGTAMANPSLVSLAAPYGGDLDETYESAARRWSLLLSAPLYLPLLLLGLAFVAGSLRVKRSR